tara:strand:- start:15484 stop:16299 length:816 start_codon:yes stop_codon:yes gene_type:complete
MINDVPKIKHINSGQFFLIAGPCVVEGEKMVLNIAEKIVEITNKLKIPYIFKASFKKANRSRIDSFTGIGDDNALKILSKVGSNFGIPTLTDIHEANDAKKASEYVDVLQIPAFLVRQTELLVAAAKTKKTINLKKGQFMSPESMTFAVQKIKDSGNSNVLITDRGTQFGYNDLIVDYSGIPIMRKIAPTVLDVTHSIQKPNQKSGLTGGRPEAISTLAKAGIAAGIDGLFIETHFDPKNAKSDGANMLDINNLENLLEKLSKIRQVINKL